MAQVDVNTLREWLDGGKPVTVLDVRSHGDRESWSIPGSIHLDAYDALREGRPDALAGLAVSADYPIVTVCNRGKVSQLAAEQLRARGFDAMSLVGGMHAWGLAWNTAEVPLAANDARVIQVRRTGKGCLSYVVASAGTAAVIDASLDPAVYMRLAEKAGCRIRYVLDTHVHADHVSRSRALAEETAATFLLPMQDRVRFPFAPVSDGDSFPLGSLRVSALATPGHTMESTCYVLDDLCLFTGDTLFLSAVGRPDLHATSEARSARAHLLYRSLHRLRSLPPHLLVLPGHTSEPVPFDGVALTDTLGAISSRLNEWMDDEDAFVTRLLARLPSTPPNYQQIVELNENGMKAGIDLTELEAGANRCAVR